MANKAAIARPLSEICDAALSLASERLATLDVSDEAALFDRAVRSVASLVRTAAQVDALKVRMERDAAANDLEIPKNPLTDADLAAIRQEIERQYDRVTRDGDSSEDSPCSA
ncbi:MAG: hypothetical protein AAF850_12465 [Pseudomonadota bacterium]